MKLPKVGEEIEVTIQSIAFGGDGIARHDNYVLFVPDVIPGEEVRVRIVETKRSFGRGEVVKALKHSPDRIKPVCKVYGICGGCQYQHMTYEKSLEVKEIQLKEILARLGGISAESICAPIQAAPKPYGYRNVISLRLKDSKKSWKVGYCGRDNKTFVPVSECPIASQKINSSLRDISEILKDFERPDKIREMTVKEGSGRTLFYPHYQKPFQFKSRERLLYRLRGFVFYYGLTNFFQVNHGMIPALVQLAEEGIEPVAGETLFDLYAGVGLFSIVFAKQFHRVVGIEMSREAVSCFQQNIRENRLENVIAVRGAVEEKMEEIHRKFKGKSNSVLLDPPREGLKPNVIELLKKMPFRKMVYVSCDPSTLARDLKSLKDCYKIRKVTPVDLFPQTKHLETVTILDRIETRA